MVAVATGRPEGFNRGNFFVNHSLCDVTNEMTIARKKIFWPVLSIIR